MVPQEAQKIAYYPLPQFTPEERVDMGGLFDSSLRERFTGEQPSTSLFSLDNHVDVSIFDPRQNKSLAATVDKIATSRSLPVPTVEGMLAQLFIEVGLPREVVGDDAHVIAFGGNEYGHDAKRAEELKTIDPHTLIVTKIVGGPKFRDNLRLYYQWAKAAAPLVKVKDRDEDVLQAPLDYELEKKAGDTFIDWIDHSTFLGAYTLEQAAAKKANPAAEMRKLIEEYDLNQGRVMGSEWEKPGRQAILDEAHDNYRAYLDQVVVPLMARGTNVYILVSNFEGETAGEDHKWHNATLDVWAGVRGQDPATIRLDPRKEAQDRGVMMLNQNMLFSTTDGRVLIASVPFFNLITGGDPAHRAGQLEAWQKQIVAARRQGRHPILVLATHPYLPESEPWRGLKDPRKMPLSWSESTGSLTAKSLVALHPELVQFAHTPDLRRGYARELVDPNAYWVANPDTTELRKEGEPMGSGDSFIFHSPVRSTAIGVLYRGEPMGMTSRSLPPRILENAQR